VSTGFNENPYLGDNFITMGLSIANPFPGRSYVQRHASSSILLAALRGCAAGPVTRMVACTEPCPERSEWEGVGECEVVRAATNP